MGLPEQDILDAYISGKTWHLSAPDRARLLETECPQI